MILRAWAKINLTLDVTGLREDGYHLLDTVMQTVSLHDRVELLLTEEPGVRLSADRKTLPVNEKNTAARAAHLFLAETGRAGAGVSIRLEKRIPSRAGLGGGSADAAAVLWGLNQLTGAGAPLDRLLAWGAEIGADVPFCLMGGTRRCRGVGERMEPAPPLPDCFILICKPPAGISTPRAYALLDRLPPTRAAATPRMLDALASGDLRRVGGALGNRFDQAVNLMPARRLERAMLASGAAGAMMSGSGSAVYGLFENEAAARACMALLADQGECFLCRPVRSPLDSGALLV